MLNLVYDLSCTAIPWDNVDPEYLVTPRSWSASSVSAFMLRFGPVSSIFDWLTYALMYFVVCPAFVSDGRLFTNIAAGSVVGSGLLAGMDMQQAYIALFQTGWFVASMWTQSMVIHMIRTPKVPFLQSRASVQVTLATLLGAVALTLIPFTPLGALIGLVPLPGIYFVYLALILVGYMALTTLAKKAYIRRYGELL
jgi:Mg2+-importing ATPase